MLISIYQKRILIIYCESLGLSPVSPNELKISEVISVGEKSEKIDLVLKLSDIFDAIGYAFELKIELDSKNEERDRIVKFENKRDGILRMLLKSEMNFWMPTTNWLQLLHT